MIPLPHSGQRIALRVLSLAALLPGLAAAQPAEGAYDEDASYSYVRTLEGRATLASDGRGPGAEADLNQPLMQGDTVRVDRGARIEIALADRNLLRVGEDSTVVLARVAFSADRDDRTTRLDLDEGEILLLVGEDALGDELPEIRTPSGTIYVHEPGEYRVTFDPNGGLEVVVRSGYAELLTERGSTVVRAGESAWTDGDRYSRVELADAGPFDTLERWGEELEREAYVAEERTLYVEPEYRYAAAPLQRYGSWVYVDSTWCWRPRVTVDWRPYWNGRWAWTPSGLTWVSAEPWGWLPYHYGTWYQAAGFGWCWRPGRVYSPAWVYWHVGPSWTGWCPVGYYTNYYRSHWSNGFRHGLYGWAGGSWSHYSDWNFCRTDRVYDRYHRDGRYTGAHVGRYAGGEPHGLLTTDTRGLERADWGRGDIVVTKIGRRAGGATDRLPVVTDFVARKRELPPAVEHAVVAERRGGRRAASPLDPQPAGGATVRAEPGWRAQRAAPGRDGRVVSRDVPRGDIGTGGNGRVVSRDVPRGDIGSGGNGRVVSREVPRGDIGSGGGGRVVSREVPRGDIGSGGNGRVVSRDVPRGDIDHGGGGRVVSRDVPRGDIDHGRTVSRDVPRGEIGNGRGVPREVPSGGIGGIDSRRVAPSPPRGGGSGSSGDERRRWQDGTPYERGGAASEGGTRTLPATGSYPRRVERVDEQPVSRVIGGVRRGAPEVDGRSESVRPAPESSQRGRDASVGQRPSYGGPSASGSYPGDRSTTYRPRPDAGTSRQQPVYAPGRGSSSSGVVQQRPPSSGTSQVSSPPPSSRGNSGQVSGSRGNSGGSSRSSGSTSSSRGSSASGGSQQGGGSDSPPASRGGGSGRGRGGR